jgi:hypothetical protein
MSMTAVKRIKGGKEFHQQRNTSHIRASSQMTIWANWRVELAQVASYLPATRSQPACSNSVKASLTIEIEDRNSKGEGENGGMTKQERALLESLDELVRSNENQIRPIVERVRAELTKKTDARMTWEPIAREIFPELPSAIQSAWVFVLRAGTDTGAERHPNSHQRMMTFAGSGDMKLDALGTTNDVDEESEIAWHSHVLSGEAGAPLERRWISIPKNVWHRPVVSSGEDWTVVSFHTVPAEDLIEERPGARQMLYTGGELQH